VFLSIDTCVIMFLSRGLKNCNITTASLIMVGHQIIVLKNEKEKNISKISGASVKNR